MIQHQACWGEGVAMTVMDRGYWRRNGWCSASTTMKILLKMQNDELEWKHDDFSEIRSCSERNKSPQLKPEGPPLPATSLFLSPYPGKSIVRVGRCVRRQERCNHTLSASNLDSPPLSFYNRLRSLEKLPF